MISSQVVAALCLISATVVVHLAGIGFALVRVRQVRNHDPFLYRRMYALRWLLGVTLLIIVLHAIEVTIWAAFYRWVGAFDDTGTALFFSLGSYSTVGSAAVILPPPWRLLGGVEGLVGTLMFGLSTAFIFSVLNAVDHLWQGHEHQKGS